jgi:glycosidase
VAACSPAVPSPSGPAGSGPATSASASAAIVPQSCPPAPAGGSPAAENDWSDRVFYEVFVRSFQDSDGDGIGDLRGLIDRLDRLNDGDPATTDDLGVTGLWLMPVAESGSYHGYDVTDYRAIEADYGTADDFRALMAAAHERGIDVIVDFVLNHTSRDHAWFQDALTPGSEHDDWYVWSDTRPAIARSDGSRVWHEAGDRFYYGYFGEGMPDLNLANAEVTAAIDDLARFWLDELGVDGFRIDAARHVIEDGKQLENAPATFEWLAAFRERLKADHPDALVLGEVFDATSMSARYIREGSLDLTFDFGLAGAVITTLNSRDGGSLNASLAEVAEAYPNGGFATFLTNHDQNRVADQLAGDPAALKLAATLLLTSPGVPFLYYGEEIGMSGRKPDERIRTPMRWDATEPAAGFSTATPWQPLSIDPAGTDVASEAADPDSLLATYRTVIRLRSEQQGLAVGDWTAVEASERGIVAFLRHVPGETLLVVANVSNQPLDAVRLDLEAGPLCGAPAADTILGDGVAAPPTVTAAGGFADYAPLERLAPREAVVLRIGP